MVRSIGVTRWLSFDRDLYFVNYNNFYSNYLLASIHSVIIYIIYENKYAIIDFYGFYLRRFRFCFTY